MRTTNGPATRKRKNRIFHRAKGFVGGRRRLLRSAKETLLRAGMFAFRDRRARKREFRKLFIIRLSAAAEMRGLRYSRLIHGLKLAKIGLDRKSLSELAIHDPQTFDAIVTLVRAENRQARRRGPRTPEGQKGLSDFPSDELDRSPLRCARRPLSLSSKPGSPRSAVRPRPRPSKPRGSSSWARSRVDSNRHRSGSSRSSRPAGAPTVRNSTA